jgi:hypothetical protein
MSMARTRARRNRRGAAPDLTDRLAAKIQRDAARSRMPAAPPKGKVRRGKKLRLIAQRLER